MMNFEEFTKEVAENIKSFLPEWYDNAKVEVEQMNKLNESYLGLRVSIPDENIAPCLNLNGAYRAYENGVSIEQIMERAAYTITTPVPEVDTKAFLDYEQIKDKLFIRVSNYEKNQDALADIPHERVEDLAITYHILVEAIDDGVGSVTIHNGLMEQYGITQEQLHQDAVANSQKIMPPEIESMASIMENSMRAEMLMNGCSEDEIDEMIASVSAEVDMYVIRNESHVNGASAIFYPDMMDDVAKLMNGDFYIIPSSTDEVIVIPDDGNASVAYMNAMVNEVNAAEVSPEMRLGNEVYHYASGEYFEYTDKEAYLRCIQNEIEYAPTSGFRFETRSDDPELRKAVDDEVYNLYGMDNPHDLAYYQPKEEQTPGCITFYVAECMEFPEHGELHEGLTIKEAFDIYEKIPSDRMNGIKGIGFEIDDGSIYDGKFDLMRGRVVQDEMINYITHYRNSPLVQDAIRQCREELNARGGEISDGIEAGAYVIGDKYLSMQVATDGSWDYTLYDSDYKLIDGGQVGDGNMSFADARNEILQSFGMMEENLRSMNPEVLAERTSVQESIEPPDYQKEFLAEMSAMGIDVDSTYVGGKNVSLTDHVMTADEVKDTKRQIEYDGIPKMLYTPDQWKEIESGMKHKLDVKVYANPDYTASQMKEIRLGLDKGVDVSAFANPEFSDKQMREIRRGVEAGLDVSSYAHPDMSAGEMRKAFFALKDGTNALENQSKSVEPDKDSGLYRYYSTQRPVTPGTFPGKPTNIQNFDTRESVCGGQMQAWGYVEYKKPLTEKQMNDYELKPAVHEAVAKEQPSFSVSEKPVEKETGKKKSVMENLRKKQAQIAQADVKKTKSHDKGARE